MNKVKIFLLTVFVALASVSLFSQNVNSKLLVKFEQETLTEMKQQNSSEFEVLEYYVDRGFHFVDMPDKPIDFEELEKINPKTGETVYDFDLSTIDLDNFNPLEFNCEIKANQKGYYKVGITGKLLIVKHRVDIENKIENEKRILEN